MTSENHDDPLDAGLAAAFGGSPPSEGPQSVLTLLQEKTGQAPRVSLRDEDSALGGASPVIDPRSAEKLALPQGRGNYQLMGEIARGGMGVVLKGHDTDLGRDVALKVLHKDLSHRPEVLQRFVEEAQIGGQLQHPGIVPVYELGLMADDRPFFTMKLVKGRTLATLLAERESVGEDRRKLLDVFASVCQTVAYAHSRGVIHRDLKPANIMVGAFGEVQVVDWGLAKVLARGGIADEQRATEASSMHTMLETVRSPGARSGHGSGTQSLVGSVMGTPAYMPPEQAAGLVDKLDERSDVFALGAILCEILTGKPPYPGKADEALIQAAQGELAKTLTRLSTCEASEELIKLTKQCLLPAMEARPRNAGILADRVRGYLEALEERARQLQIQAAQLHVRTEEAVVHAHNERRARKLTLALAAAITGILVVGSGGWLWIQNERTVRREQAAAAELERAEREAEIESSISLALGEAKALTGEQEWDAAEAAIERAQSLAETARSRERWSAAVEVRTSELQKAREAARFVAELERIEQGSDAFFNFARIDAEYARQFSAFGIDVDASTPDQVANTLAERGVGIEATPAVDSWIAARSNQERVSADQEQRPEDLEGSLHLVEVAHALDDDVLRADLREALINNDVEMLRQLASEDLSEQPPSTLTLLSAALRLANDPERALNILREGVLQHPASYELRTALLANLGLNPLLPSWERDECFEGILHSQAALALRPENVGHQAGLFWGFIGLARDSERRAEHAEARKMYQQALVHLDALHRVHFKPSQYLWRGWALQGAGHEQLAQEAFAALIKADPPFDHSFGKTPEEWRYYYFVRAGSELLRGGSLDDALLAFEPLLDLVERGAVRNTWSGRVFGEWALARTLQRAREADSGGALRVMREAVEQSELTPAQASAWVAFSVALLPRSVLYKACGATTPQERTRIQAAIDSIQLEALRLAETLDRDIDRFRISTLIGILRYRTGDLDGALEALGMTAEDNAYEWYPTAMVLHELGNEEAARTYYDRACADTASRPISTRGHEALFELLELRNEADIVLGVPRGD